MALLAALVEFTKSNNIELHVITVDHGLRAETKHEIALVTDLCARWELPHHVEFWTGWTGDGNLQAAARDARYGLIADWAYGYQISHVALGHTADDQAETFLDRLTRGSGVSSLKTCRVPAKPLIGKHFWQRRTQPSSSMGQSRLNGTNSGFCPKRLADD